MPRLDGRRRNTQGSDSTPIGFDFDFKWADLRQRRHDDDGTTERASNGWLQQAAEICNSLPFNSGSDSC